MRMCAIMGVCILLALTILCLILYERTKHLSCVNKKLENYKALWKTFYDANTNYVYLKDKNLNYLFINKALNFPTSKAGVNA